MSKHQLLMLTMRKVILSLIGIGVIAAMFWYVNTYIYKFYAGSAVVKVDASSTVGSISVGETFSYNVVLSGQSIETIDLTIKYDPDNVEYLKNVTVLPNTHFKNTPDVNIDNQAKGEIRYILFPKDNSKEVVKNVQLSFKFKAKKQSTTTVAVDKSSVIAGRTEDTAVIFDEDLAKATKSINIKAPVVPNEPPTITSYVWEPQNPEPGQAGKATVIGTDPDSSKVSLASYLNGNKIGNTIPNIPVVDGKWTITYNSQAPSKIGRYTSQVEVTDGVNSVKSAERAFTIGDVAKLPIAHWKMDDNVNGNSLEIIDSVGNNNAKTDAGKNNSGVNCSSNGKNDRSCIFDGDDRLNGKTTLSFGTKMSATAWIKTASGGAIFSSVTSPLVNSFYFRTNKGFVEGVTDMSSNWPNNSVRGKTKIDDDQWHHVAFVIDELNAFVYVDGVLDGSDTMASSGAFTDNNWYLGYSDASWSEHYFRGQMDDVKLFDYALTAEDVKEDSGITDTSAPPTISSVQWNIIETQNFVAVLAEGTDEDSKTVSASIYIADVKVDEQTNIPVTDGKWQLGADIVTEDSFVGKPAYIEITDGTNIVKSEVETLGSTTQTPPWVNTDYSTTTVWGAVQTEASASAQFWRENTEVCSNVSYPVAPNMSVASTTLKNCYQVGNTPLPYFSTKVSNPGNNLAYTLANIPAGYECTGWEHRLRVKSDGAPKLEASGSGCTTSPLAINIQDESSSYENSHFLLFRIQKTPEISLPAPQEVFDTNIAMKVRFQGITQQEAPLDAYKKLNAEVILRNDNTDVSGQIVEFTYNQDGTWDGVFGANNITSGSKYSILIKGAKHLTKKICINNPSEQLSGTYKCEVPSITIQKGNNNLDFSQIVLLGGDIPQQDGIINALDFAFIRQNLGNRDPQNLVRGDLNLDGIIDTQDYTIIVTALGFKYDEE